MGYARGNRGKSIEMATVSVIMLGTQAFTQVEVSRCRGVEILESPSSCQCIKKACQANAFNVEDPVFDSI